ncbi:MAG: type II toxin-antitoxin system RelE/ParE family toxin [Sulfuricella sp.]
MPALIWLPDALEDIGRLFDFLAEKNPLAAADAICCMQAAAVRLEKFPELGAPMGDDTRRRQVFTAFGAGDYVLRYRLNQNGDPVIIRVWHSREARK